jgi:hypothetical protein
MFRRTLSMCPINFVFISCKVKKQESPEYYSVVNEKTLGSHLKSRPNIGSMQVLSYDYDMIRIFTNGI